MNQFTPGKIALLLVVVTVCAIMIIAAISDANEHHFNRCLAETAGDFDWCYANQY